jgi:hypothetical protein
MFCSDYPRGVVNGFWLCWFPVPDPLPVAPALTIPFLLSCRRLPVSLLRLPPRPSPRRRSAAARCNSAGVLAWDETVARILSAGNTASVAGVPIASADPLDFRDDLYDSREGPWEVMTPRSSCPGGGPIPLWGAANLRLTATQYFNGKMRRPSRGGATLPPTSRIVAQLLTAWVTFGKQTWATSPKR